MLLEQPRERFAGELAALIGVEDLRRSIPVDRFFHRLQAERDVHRDRHAPGEHPARAPVDHGREIHEATRHRDVGNVHGPDLVGPIDGQMAQQIRVDRMPGMPAARVRLAVQRLDAHTPHQGRHVLAADREAVLAEQVAQHATPGERVFEVQPVDPAHEVEILLAHGPSPVVHAAAADAQDRSLPGDR